jgi:hypothetical protein
MRLPSIEDVLGRLAQLPGARHGAGLREAELVALEARLGVTLPAGQRALLAKLGWLDAAGVAVLGAGGDVPPELDLARIVEENRGQTRGLLPVARDLDRSLLGLDPAHQGPYQPPLHRLSGDPDPAASYVAHDLAAWLQMRFDVADSQPSRGDSRG